METGEILSTGSVTHLAGLIEACNFPNDALFLAEQLPQYVIEHEQRQGLLLFARLADIGDLKNAESYTSGRIFSETCELRWEKESNGDYQVVYFGPERELAGLSKNVQESQNIGSYKQEYRDYYLFGERLDLKSRQFATMKVNPAPERYDYYATTRIPRLLLYPIDSGARQVQLRVLEYVDENTGRVRLFRFQKLVDEDEKRGEAKA